MGGGGEGVGHLTKFYMRRLYAKVQPLTLLSIIRLRAGYYTSSSSSSKFIKSPASGSSDLIYNNWKSNKNDL